MVTKSRWNQLYRFAVAVCKDENAAFDLLHSCIEKLLDRGEDINDLPNAYLFKMMRNRAIDEWRKEKTRAEEDADIEHITPIDQVNFEEVLCSRQDAERVLSLLKPEEREIIFLHLVEGYKTKEISEITGIPQGTLLSKIHRIKRNLKRQLGDQKVVPGGES